MSFAASLTIPTRNRAGILRECILSALNQTVPVEIIVLDDGSTDNTEEMIRTEFPQVRYERFLQGPNGPCVLRNRGAQMASADILFPIDDDSVFSSNTCVETTLAEFNDPRIGAVAIPYIQITEDDILRSNAPDDKKIYVCPSYLGASYAIRKDVFLGVGGYREPLFYMGEERDLCIRMLEHGYVVRLGMADPIHHHTSPVRDASRARRLERRNDISHVLWNVPMPHVFYHLPGTILTGIVHGVRLHYLPLTLKAYLDALLFCRRHLGERLPVSSRTYLLSRKLNRIRVLPIEEVTAEMGPLVPFPKHTQDHA